MKKSTTHTHTHLSPESLVDELVELVRSAGALQLVPLEERATFQELLPARARVARLVSKSIDLLQRVAHLHESGDDRSPSSVDRSSARPKVATSKPPESARERKLRHLDDLAFIAVSDLRRQQSVLLARDPQPRALISTMEGIVRRIKKSLNVVGESLCDLSERTHPMDFRADLKASIETRRCFARLRRTIDFKAASEDATEIALRDIKTEIVILMGRPTYKTLRLTDRIVLRDLKDKLIQWLKLPSGSSKTALGERHWVDLQGVSNILAGVSQRQELVANDSAIIRRAHTILTPLPGGSSVPADLLQDFKELEGLHNATDALVLEGCRQCGRWKQCLLELEPQRFTDAPVASAGPAAFAPESPSRSELSRHSDVAPRMVPLSSKAPPKTKRSATMQDSQEEPSSPSDTGLEVSA